MLSWRTSFVAVMSLLMAVVAAPASAQDQVFPDISVDEMVQMLVQWGYPAEVEDLDDGSQVIRSSAAGLNFDVNFFNCGEGKWPRCRDLQWQVAFNPRQPPTLDVINQWNVDWRFARADLYQGQYVYMEFDLRLTGGVSAETIREYTMSYETVMQEFATHIGW